MSERDLARTGRRAPADESRGRDRVVGRPETLAIFVTSIASARLSGGNSEGSRRAPIDLPAPGGPTTSSP